MLTCSARIRLRTLIALSVLFLGGACQPQEEIATYTIERTSPPKPAFKKAEVAGQLDHTLAAMLPLGETVWFFKLAGPAEAVARQRDLFGQFVSSVQKGDSQDKPITWQSPAGWTEKGPSEMRLATIAVPDEKQQLEIAISSLPLSGDWEDVIAMNVNRWLGQLSQGELAKSAILKQTTEIETAAGPATVIELAGILQKSSMMNPHAEIQQARPPKSPPQPPAAEESIAAAGFQFKKPVDWQPGQTSSMRKVAFNVVSMDKQAEMTVIALPSSAGPQITDVRANVERWAGQVGLPRGTNLQEFIEKIEIDGNSGSFASLRSPSDVKPSVTMLVAMVEHDNQVWFFKILGDAELVEEQRQAFQDFLASVRFD